MTRQEQILTEMAGAYVRRAHAEESAGDAKAARRTILIARMLWPMDRKLKEEVEKS